MQEEVSRYQALAASYDELTVDVGYLRRADYLERQFRKSPIPVRTVLDLACGTGTMACLLAQRGYEVTATDASEEMLTQAMTKAAALTERPPLFLHQTMPRLRLLEPVDAAICTLDARETLRRVCRWLKPGGVFYFDVNTPWKLRRMDRQIYMDETEESLCVWRTFFSEKRQTCTYQVDLFRQRADGAWDRSFEEHRERAWTEEELRQALAEAGFTAVKLTGDLTSRPPKPTEDRWIITAQRPVE